MAHRRMFSPDIVGSDAFLEMPVSSQNLYFHLGMYADDDGFVNPKKIINMVGSGDDDLKILIAKRFLLAFANGVVVVKHWLIHNLIRGDRYKETMYLDEKKSLFVKENKSYTELATNGKPNGNQRLPQVKLSKVRLIKEEVELPIWLNKNAWNAWEQYRKERGKKLTPISIKLQIRFLETNKEDHIQIIKNSITNGWTGLFPLKKDEFVKKLPPRFIEPSTSKEDNDRRNELLRQSEKLSNSFKIA